MKYFSVFLALLFSFILQAQEEGINLLQCDPSFEKVEFQTIKIGSGCWVVKQSGKAGVQMKDDASKSGDKCLHLFTSDTERSAFFSEVEYKEKIQICSSKKYRIGCWVNHPTGESYDWRKDSRVFIKILFLNEEDEVISEMKSSPYTTPSTEWELLEIPSLKPPENAVSLIYRIRLEKHPVKTYGQSKINVDDAFIESLNNETCCELDLEGSCEKIPESENGYWLTVNIKSSNEVLYEKCKILIYLGIMNISISRK